MFLIKNFNWHIKLTAIYRLSYNVLICVKIRASASVSLNINHFHAAKILIFSLLSEILLTFPAYSCPGSFGPDSASSPEAMARRRLVFSTWPFAIPNSRILGFMSLQPSLPPSTLPHPPFLSFRSQACQTLPTRLWPQPKLFFINNTLSIKQCAVFLSWNDSADFVYF